MPCGKVSKGGELIPLNADPDFPGGGERGGGAAGAIRVSCAEDASRRFAVKPLASATTEYGSSDRLLLGCSSAVLSVSDDESVTGFDDEDAMLPSEVGNLAADVLPLPPVILKKRPSRSLHRGKRLSKLLRASMFPAEGPSDLSPVSRRDWDLSSPAPPSPAVASPPEMGRRARDPAGAWTGALPPLPSGPALGGRVVVPPHSGAARAHGAPHRRHPYASLRRFADAMKRSEDTRRRVVHGRRLLRGTLYRGLEGGDHLLSGEPWGRSASYLVSRRELVSDVYGRLLSAHREPSSSSGSGAVPLPAGLS